MSAADPAAYASPRTAPASTSARASAWAADVESLAMRLARDRGGGGDEPELGGLCPGHLDDEGDPVPIPPREVLAGGLLGGGVLHHESGIRTPPDHPAPELGHRVASPGRPVWALLDGARLSPIAFTFREGVRPPSWGLALTHNVPRARLADAGRDRAVYAACRARSARSIARVKPRTVALV